MEAQLGEVMPEEAESFGIDGSKVVLCGRAFHKSIERQRFRKSFSAIGFDGLQMPSESTSFMKTLEPMTAQEKALRRKPSRTGAARAGTGLLDLNTQIHPIAVRS